MKKLSPTMAFAYVFAAKVQAIGLVIFGWFLSQYLEDVAPLYKNWYMVVLPFTVLVAGYNFYAVFRVIIRNEKHSQKDSSKED